MIRTLIDDPYLGRRNSIHKSRLRQIEKNRFPKKCECVVCGEFFLCGNIEDYLRRQYYLGPKNGKLRHVCWGCDLKHKVRAAAGTLYQLIRAIPQAERDWQEIFPADFRHALIPLSLQSNYSWRRFEEWLREGVVLCGMTATGRDSQGLRDYSEGTRFLTKYGKQEFAYRQKAASVVRDILAITSAFVDLPAIERRLALYLLGRLPSPETQSTLKRIGRLYKNSCWWSKKDPRCLFDKAQALSWKKSQLYKPGDRPYKQLPQDDRFFEFQEIVQILGGVSVGFPGYWNKPFWLRSHKRHANLAETRAAYNDRHGSYWNSTRDNLGRANLTKTFRALCSLNIPRETIEVRNAMIINLERDFAPRKEAKAA